MANRVWILGAGFSKPLGGPLIGDLLAMRELGTLRTLFPKADYQDLADEQYKVRVFYDYGRKRGYWDHAEQFLDLVESAAAEQIARFAKGSESPGADLGPQSHGSTLLESLLKGVVRDPQTHTERQGEAGGYSWIEVPNMPIDFDDLRYLARAARRALAVDCSVFLRSAQLDSERWQPHVDWVKALHGEDTVITFNYDHVPELLSAATGKLRVVNPVHPEVHIPDARSRREPIVLKLHGSVTWVADQDAIKVISLKDAAFGNPSTDVLIGVPGPGKRKVYREALGPLRQAAMAAIREARQVIFVGYRFPPTDGDTRRDIIDAIRLNRERGFFSVRTVLGPNVDGADSNRLRHLLLSVTQAQVMQVPLYTEDYFSLLGLGDAATT